MKDNGKSVPFEEFGHHVRQMHADRDKLFELEYTVRNIKIDMYKNCNFLL